MKEVQLNTFKLFIQGGLALLLGGVSYGFASSSSGADFHVQTEITPAVSFFNYKGAGPIYATPSLRSTQPQGSLSLFGLGLKQSFGYKDLAILDIAVTGAISAGGESTNRHNVIPAKARLFDLSAVLYTSIALESERTAFIEPALGFSSLWAHLQNMQDSFHYGEMHNWRGIIGYGPSAGVYLRVCPMPQLSIRFGGMYIMSRIQEKIYMGDGAWSSTSNYSARRHGLLGQLSFDYAFRDWVSFMFGVDYQTLSASGISQDPNARVGNQPNSNLVFLTQVQLKWGAQFSY